MVAFFLPAAERLLGSEHPSRVLAAALAAMSGFRKPPQPRSLLTYEAGLLTLRLVSDGSAGAPVDGWSSLVKALKAICRKAGIKKVGRVGRAGQQRA